MALVIEGILEQRFDQLAKERGISPLDLVKSLIDSAATKRPDPSDSIVQWLDATERNWETSDPAELAIREAEGEACTRELAAGRELTHCPDARKL